MKKLVALISILTLSACSTPTKQNIDFAKLKADDRVYGGMIQVELNGKTNSDLTCDFFLNSDIAPTVRLAKDGIFQFKSNRNKLNFSKIACIHKVDKKNYWVRHSLDLPRIQKSDITKAKEVTDMGTLKITWVIDDSEVQPSESGIHQKDDMSDVGKLEVKKLDTGDTKPPSPNL